jgi:Protein of unknown function (DUF3349)
MADTTSLAQSVLNWLRAGYPEGIPPQDYLPLLETLHRRLTDEEIHSIAAELAAQSAGTDAPISRDDIEEIISKQVYQSATDADVARISARLAAGGWPLADPHSG